MLVWIEACEVVPVRWEAACFSKSQHQANDVERYFICDCRHACRSDAPDSDDDCKPDWCTHGAQDHLAGQLERAVAHEEQTCNEISGQYLADSASERFSALPPMTHMTDEPKLQECATNHRTARD